MKATNKQISLQFSEGNFPFCYEHFDIDIEWNLVGNNVTTGKDNIISHCEKMMVEMANSTLKNTNIVGENDNFAIEGICHYIGADNRPAEVAYCDVFQFNNEKIARITSYCIEK